ncbi:hypothetical protein [Fibrella arboris]
MKAVALRAIRVLAINQFVAIIIYAIITDLNGLRLSDAGTHYY